MKERVGSGIAAFFYGFWERWVWMLWALNLALAIHSGSRFWLPFSAFFLGLCLKERFGRSLYRVGQGIKVKYHRPDRFWRFREPRADPVRIEFGGAVSEPVGKKQEVRVP